MKNIIDSDVYFATQCREYDFSPKTSLWNEFSTMEAYGKTALFTTAQHAWRRYRHDARSLAELNLVLNWKIWQYAESSDDRNQALARCYNTLWTELDDAMNKITDFTSEDWHTIYSVLD